MARFLKKRDASMGEAPGSLIFIGEKKVDKVSAELIDYDDETLNEREFVISKDSPPSLKKDTVSWINICGLHDTAFIELAGGAFSLHPLTLEDIVNTGQRPKMEEYGPYLYFTMKMMRYEEKSGMIESEQLSIVLGRDYLITFQELPGDVFDPVRTRIRNGSGRVRKSGADYLAYALLDTIVDNYIFIIERLGEKIEAVEDLVGTKQNNDILERINDYKREINYLRKTVRPVREFILHLVRLDSDIIEERTKPFLRDLLDLSTQAVEITDTYRDMLSDQLAIYNTMISNRLNEIMKVLTIFSTVFIPLTFIAGIYGTNFEYLPELGYRYAYFVFWGILVLIALLMLYFFRRKKWI